MIPVLADDEGSKRKPENGKVFKDAVGDEARSFLSFSRKNLSVSRSDLEQGFNRPRFHLRRHDILSGTAILLALLCIGIEIWKLRCVMANAKEIEILKQDVESLKHRLLEEDLFDEFKAFEEQFFAEGRDDDDDDDVDDDDDDNDDDYDMNYSDDLSLSQEYSGDYHVPLYNTQHSEPGKGSSEKDFKEVLAALHKVEAERGLQFEKKVQENLRSIERDRLFEDEEHRKMRKNESVKEDEEILRESTTESVAKRPKRSIPEERPAGFSRSGVPIFSASYMRNKQNASRGNLASRLQLYEDLTNGQKVTTENSEETPAARHRMITSWDRHPPKKYYAQRRPATAHVSPNSRYNTRGSASLESLPRRGQSGNRRRFGRREEAPMALKMDELGRREDGEVEEVAQNSEVSARNLRRGVSRRHLRGGRQVFAAHYAADSTLFGNDDEHTGNGRARHDRGIFKAWRQSDWVRSLNMTRHFSLADDGRLTVNEPGLYFVYAQIHYLDEHDENGFHVLVNDDPLFQCMLYSPGTGHKSRSCFSAQVTLLQAGDRLVLKDVGPARYTLFQQDKSFFGLMKLGDTRSSK